MQHEPDPEEKLRNDIREARGRRGLIRGHGRLRFRIEWRREDSPVSVKSGPVAGVTRLGANDACYRRGMCESAALRRPHSIL